MASTDPATLAHHRYGPSPPPPAAPRLSAGINVSFGQQHQHQQQQQQQQPKPIRRRMRMITSCLECRRRKLKCNKSNPCTNCLKFARDCLYLGPKLDEASQLRLTEIKEKVGSLERQLERDVAKSGSASGSSASARAAAAAAAIYEQRILADDVEGEFDEERDLEITPMVALDLTYEDDADGADDIMDLGVQVGRMRLTEKIGGLNRPRISEEIQAGLSTPVLQQQQQLQQNNQHHHQQQHPFAAAAASTATGFIGGGPHHPPPPPPSAAELPDFLRPGASYIPPTSGVFFGQVVQSPSLLTFLPPKSAGDRLLAHYFTAVHPIARCVHRPTLESQYASFWAEAAAGYEPRASVQAVVFAAWFSAAVAALDSPADSAVAASLSSTTGLSRASLVETMKMGTEVALSKANFLRTTRVDTMQAFVMYMIPLCRDQVSRAHSVLVGAAVRMAECMGLHRDGSKAYNLNPLETHVRRLIWHQLCFLDIRTCEAQGPKPSIRREDYDTWLPDNIGDDDDDDDDDQDDDDNNNDEGSDGTQKQRWTTTLPSLIRFEINEMMRLLWADRRKLEARRITLTQVLTKIETFRKRMLDTYTPLLDNCSASPLQRYSKCVMHLLLYRLHVMILHPYYANTANPLPARLRAVLLTSAVVIIELAVELDTQREFAAWRWYAGAYQQYHSALVLATEMFYHPHQRDAARIWRCLDYVFELGGEQQQQQQQQGGGGVEEEKGRRILVEIMGKMGVYMSMRRMRAPTLTACASPSMVAVKAEENSGNEARATTTTTTTQGQTSYPPPMRNPRPKDEGMVPVPVPPMMMAQQQQMLFSRHDTPILMSAAAANTTNNGTPASGWPQPLAPPPPPVLMRAESPGNSSSDGGSVCMGTGTRINTAMALGGGGGGVQAMDGDWSNYQEDAINALFAGFGESIMGGSGNVGLGHSGGGWGGQQQQQQQQQSRHM